MTLMKVEIKLCTLLFLIGALVSSVELNGQCLPESYSEFPCVEYGSGVNTGLSDALQIANCIIIPKGISNYNTAISARTDVQSARYVNIESGTEIGPFVDGGVFKAAVELNQTQAVIMAPLANPGFVGTYEKFEVGIKLPLTIQDQIDDFIANGPGIDRINPYNPIPNEANVPDPFQDPSLGNTIPADGIDVHAFFISPSGEIKKGFGFYYELIDPTNFQPCAIKTEFPFRLRTSFDEVGEWTIHIHINATGFSPMSISPLKVNCFYSGKKGYVEKAWAGQYLQYSDDGSTFFPIGQNLWHPTDKGGYETQYPTPQDLPEWEDRFLKLSSNGANMIRYVFLPNKGGLHEWGKGGQVTAKDALGNYHHHQYRLYEFDRILELAQENDIYLYIQLFEWANQRLFAIKRDWCFGGNQSFWYGENYNWYNYLYHFHPSVLDCEPVINNKLITDRSFLDNDVYGNPYREIYDNSHTGANRKPDKLDPWEFLANPIAKKYVKRMLRYIRARWGYSTNLSVLEFFSEMDQLLDKNEGIPHADMLNSSRTASWHVEMDKYLKSDLGWPILTTTSTAAKQAYSSDFWNGTDLTNIHQYDDYFRDHDHARNSRQFRHNFSDKPVFTSEDGLTLPLETGCRVLNSGDQSAAWAAGEYSTLGWHNILWSGSFSGGCNAPFHWMWDYIEGTDSYFKYLPLSKYFENVNLAAQSFYPCISQNYTIDQSFLPNENKIVFPLFQQEEFEVQAILNHDRNEAYGWVHLLAYNHANPWANPSGSRDCIDANGTEIPNGIPDVQDIGNSFWPLAGQYFDPGNNSVTFAIKDVQFGKYRVEIWSTRGSGGLISSYTTFSVPTTFTPVLYVGLNGLVFNESTPDVAFKIYKEPLLKADGEISQDSNQVTIYPNPGNGLFYIDIVDGPEVIPAILVSDIHGKEVMNMINTNSGKLTLDLSSHPPGVYLVQIRLSDRVETKRIVKN